MSNTRALLVFLSVSIGIMTILGSASESPVLDSQRRGTSSTNGVETVHIPKASMVKFKVSQNMVNACYKMARVDIPWKDPDSVKFVSAHHEGIQWYYDGQLGERRFLIKVNAKNSFGGYSGPQLLECHVVDDAVVSVKP